MKKMDEKKGSRRESELNDKIHFTLQSNRSTFSPHFLIDTFLCCQAALEHRMKVFFRNNIKVVCILYSVLIALKSSFLPSFSAWASLFDFILDFSRELKSVSKEIKFNEHSKKRVSLLVILRKMAKTRRSNSPIRFGSKFKVISKGYSTGLKMKNLVRKIMKQAIKSFFTMLKTLLTPEQVFLPFF